MRSLIALRNSIEKFSKAHYRITSYIVKLVIVFVSLVIIRANTGYNTLLSNIAVIIILSVACAFIPLRILLFVLLAYVALQLFSLSVGIAIVSVVLLLIMYMIYFRFSKKHAYVVILLPLLFMIKIPLVIPLFLAVTASFYSVVPVIFGTIIYYMLRYINLNATVFSDSAQTAELAKVSIFLEGTFAGNEFLYTLAVMVIVFIVTYLIKRKPSNYSNDMAVAIGTGLYIILLIISNMAFGTITASKLWTVVLGAVASGIIVELLHNVALPLDYTRTELLQFEDNEYVYYVRAVPKAAIEKETVHVNRINTRKRKN